MPKHSPPKKPKGLAQIIIIFGAITLIAGIVIIPKLGKTNLLPQTKPQALDSQNIKTSPDRKLGHTQLNEEGRINTPVFEDEVEGVDILAGGVVTKKLKSKITAYFIIPPSEWRVNYAVISEFQTLPSSEKHVPLYTDYGFGVNVAVEGKIQRQAYLVFDFSNGEKLKEFKKLTKSINYCDYSQPDFNPEICAGLINLPGNQDTNSKYLAVRPNFISTQDHLPTYPQYSYYLGTNDLLILKVVENDFVVVQPHKPDLILDLIKDTFEIPPSGSPDQLIEMASILRDQNFTLADLNLLAKAAQTAYVSDLKSYFNNLYLQQLIKARRSDFLKQIAQETNQQGYTHLDDPDKLITNLQKEFADGSALLFNEFWAKDVARIEKGYDTKHGSIAAANLKRAFNLKIKGTATAKKLALITSREKLQKLKQDIQETYPVARDFIRLARNSLILTGKLNYSPKRTSHNPTRDLIVKAVHAQVLLPFDDDPPPPPESVLIPFPEDTPNDRADADAENAPTEAEVKAGLEALANAVELGDVTLDTVGDVLDILSMEEVMNDEALSDKWQDILEDMIRNAMNNATTDSQRARAWSYCKNYMPEIKQIECANYYQKNKGQICAIRKIPSHGLKILAPFKDIELDCKKMESNEPPLEPLRP